MNNNILIAAAFLLLPARLSAQKDSLRAVIEKQPANIEAHKEYIYLMAKDSTSLVKQYQLWLKKFPKASAVPYGLGYFYSQHEDPAAKPYLLKAVTLDPELAEAWFELSNDAQCWGDFKKSEEYMANAVRTAPDDPNYLFYYAFNFLETDPAKADALIKILRSKFPQSRRVPQMLYWKAFRVAGLQEKVAVYEDLRGHFPMAKSEWAAAGMLDYLDLLTSTDASGAVKMATILLQQTGLDSLQKVDVEAKKRLASGFVQVQTLLMEHRPAAANEVLRGLTIDRWSNQQQNLSLFKGRLALEAGGPKQAYDTLLACYIKDPTRLLKDTLLYYGGKAGKTDTTIYQEIKQQLMAGAKKANFKLESYLSSGQVSLDEYKGKVVLLTFWFPGCGPCRDEFPHFEKVLKAFRNQPVSYIGVNGVRRQDAYVIPFIKKSGYSFMPLKDAEPNMTVRAFPTNYLIDQDGFIILKDFMVRDEEGELMLQDIIQLLLHKTV